MNSKYKHAMTTKDTDKLRLDNCGEISEDNQQIMLRTKATYINKKSIVVDNVDKKKKNNEIKIIREYRNLLSCEELIERIINNHSQDDYYRYKCDAETK